MDKTGHTKQLCEGCNRMVLTLLTVGNVKRCRDCRAAMLPDGELARVDYRNNSPDRGTSLNHLRDVRFEFDGRFRNRVGAVLELMSNGSCGD